MNLKNWSLIRLIRTILVVFITFQALETETWWMLIISAYLLYQVITNQSCKTCDTCSCDTTKKTDNNG